MIVAYKATAVKAAEEMPAIGTLRRLTKHVHDLMTNTHPEISWGVQLVKCATGEWDDTVYMARSYGTSFNF